MRSIHKKMKKTSGFTLIELLIVIGLLGALTALVLPTLTADREEALGSVCDYNQAGTVRVLKQYESLTGGYPADMHNGMTLTSASALAMPGLPDAQTTNMGDGTTIPATTLYDLTDYHGNSLREAGITSITSGTGLNRTNIPETATPSGAALGINVAAATSWIDDGGVAYQFDGITLADWEGTPANTPSWDTSTGKVICLWIAPTIDWSSGTGVNTDWSKGSVQMGIELEGQCPIPATSVSGGDPEFAYYMAYFKVYDDGSAAKLIGTSCPECGIMNP